MIYLFKFLIGSGVFIGLYFLLLQNTVIHKQKRFYLLFTLLVAMVLPFLSFPIFTPAVSVIQSVQLEQSFTSLQQLPAMVTNNTPATQSIDYTILVAYLSVLISAILLLRFFYGLYKLLTLVRSSNKVDTAFRNVVLVEKNIAPFSFMGYIFVSKVAFEHNSIENEIFIHEQAHNIQKHSLDILFVELLCCIFWFNPFMYLYKAAIKLNHEYLADEAVVLKTNASAVYMSLLLSNSSSHTTCFLTSSIYFINLKKRFIMITKSKGKTAAKFRLVAACSYMVSFVVFVSANAQVKNEIKTADKELPAGTSASKEELIRYDAILKQMSSLDTAMDGTITDKLDLGKGSQDTLAMLFRKMNVEQRKERVEKTNVSFYQNVQESDYLYSKSSYGPGATVEELKEYDETLAKMTISFVGKNGKKHNGVDMSKGNIDRLAEIYQNMNEEQRTERIKKTGITIDKALEHKTTKPTASLMSEWADSKKYGVWVNANRINNIELKKYKLSDFGDYNVSKLATNAINYGKHYFQVSLYTNKEVASWKPAKNKFIFLAREDKL